MWRPDEILRLRAHIQRVGGERDGSENGDGQEFLLNPVPLLRNSSRAGCRASRIPTAGIKISAGATFCESEAITDPISRAGITRAACCMPAIFRYPPRSSVSRLFIGAQNLIFRLLRKEFRTFAHPPSEMLAILAELGFHQTFAHHALVWQIAGLERQVVAGES